MAVNITDPDARARFEAVECIGMSSDERKAFLEDGPHSFEAFKRAFLALPEEKRKAGSYIKAGDISMIYGRSGGTRYSVRATGEMVFSAHHGGLQSQNRARSAGFTIE